MKVEKTSILFLTRQLIFHQNTEHSTRKDQQNTEIVHYQKISALRGKRKIIYYLAPSLQQLYIISERSISNKGRGLNRDLY